MNHDDDNGCLWGASEEGERAEFVDEVKKMKIEIFTRSLATVSISTSFIMEFLCKFPLIILLP